MQDVFKKLDEFIDSHEACENRFFARARARKWNSEQLGAFAPEYYYWIKSFPGILASLVNKVDDEGSRFFLLQILYSEMGSGRKDRMHYKLFGKALQSLGLSKAEINAGPRFTQTSNLVSGMQHLYGNTDILKGMGAQYALERQAFPMIDNLYQGFRHYKDLTDADFEYFKLHLVEEPEHLKSMQESVARYVSSPENFGVLRAGASECLDLIASFWQRLFIEVLAFEEG